MLQVVRRFGLVGGMESYVWNLSRSLSSLGVEVSVVCESVHTDPDFLVEIDLVQKSDNRRRWKAMQDFMNHSEKLLNKYRDDGSTIIHSHERCSFHQVTTIHGPPMPRYDGLPWYKKISPRVRAWASWERREVCAENVRAVVPVSKYIRDLILSRHPCCSGIMSEPGYPGLDHGEVKHFRPSEKPLKLLFVGREWKRKGLDYAVKMLDEMKGEAATLDIYGISDAEIPGALKRQNIRALGWINEVPYSRYDVLVHPARTEPFGMVVTEALRAGCRVMTSSSVGAAEINHSGLRCLPLESGIESWVIATLDLAANIPTQNDSFWSWDDLARFYLKDIYRSIPEGQT